METLLRWLVTKVNEAKAKDEREAGVPLPIGMGPYG
jgi:hypothetical protein